LGFSKDLDRHAERLAKNKEYIGRIQYCIDNGAELNSWEDDFLDSFKDQLIEGREPSSLQLQKLEEIEYVCEWGRSAFFEEFGFRD
jgi:hypothetical protein